MRYPFGMNALTVLSCCPQKLHRRRAGGGMVSLDQFSPTQGA